ncbi:DUF11 domain-containing protein [Paenimyroides aestuarii]|uniref:DUF11 domain-containing protein n=2 Tax=Paenimyroides aestuarii TaxID=2968490 RepID=A0ABY5NUJ8_9FLAO|nr:DUF11 domain-containing protein [Paenimyroides aestuarii]UUV22265.1 DUF11 domain-containing protein [Paenimyroides aestuarii]
MNLFSKANKKSRINGFLLTILFFVISASNAQQQPVCATPGSDGVQEFPEPRNSFFPGMGNDITVNAGATSFTLDAIPSPFLVGGVLYDFGNNQISKGDLLLIIQIQGATINSANTNLYGSGNAANNGSGYLNLNNVGRYEYMVALNNVTSSGGELRFKAAGSGGGLLYSYENKPATTSQGVKRFQVVRLMQYSDLTLTSDIKTTPWNGRAGGLIAIDVAGTLNFNGKTINASLTGFRGGFLPSRSIENIQYTDYRSAIAGTNNRGSTKGEGIAGTPRYVWDGYEYLDQGATWQGYPNGDYAKGAPANAGGGGNVHNAGGGGGGNGGFGGAGGYGWPLANENPQTNNRNNLLSLQTGGRPGVALPSNVNNGLLFMGGGGGAGDANNSGDGARGGVGGGIVIITANKIAGNGFILANGGKGEPGAVASSGDGAGGGGAGGSVFINVKEPSTGNLYIQAKGGNGGHSTTVDLHGPGGGGGGGIIYYNANGANVTTDVTPGEAGRINAGQPVNAANYADFPAGANKLQNGSLPGTSGVVSSFSMNDLPSYLAASAYCYPALSIAKWRDSPLDSIPAGSMITYKIRIDNSGGGAKGVRVNDPLPASFTFVSATIDFDTTTGNPQSINNIGTPTNPILGTFDLVSGEGAYIEMNVQVPFLTTEGTYHNGVQVGYLDPTRVSGAPERIIYPPLNAISGQNTTYSTGNETVGGSNYNANQEGEEVIVVRPEIGISKTINNACADTAGNIYSIVLLNPNSYTLTNVSVTDVIDSELDVLSASGSGWTVSNVGNTYTLTLNTLAAATGATPFTSAPINITVRPKATATKSNWLNTATVPTSKGVSSSSVIMYQQPTTATASQVIFAGQCDDGIYYIQGNQPTVGVGKWEFVGDSGTAFFENPNQRNTRILGMQPNQTVSVIWKITNSSCGSVSSPPLSFTAPIRPTATISGGGTICSGAALDSAPAITVSLTPASGYKRIKYIDGGGFERFIVSSNNAPTIDIPRNFAGTYILLEVKQSTSNLSANDSGWNSICPGIVSGTAQINVVTTAPAGGVINYHGGPVCKGEIVPMSLVLTGHGGVVLGWQSSTDGNTWSAIIPGTENVTSYSPAVNTNIYYRATIGSIVVNGSPCFPNSFSGIAYVPVKDCNDISVAKTINNNTPNAGDSVTFTITATNNKEQNATGVVVQDKLPNGYTYQSHNAAAGTTYNQTTGVWNIGGLNTGQSRVLSVVATVNMSGQYTNKAVISCNEQETNYANNTAQVTPVPNCDVRNISPKTSKP